MAAIEPQSCQKLRLMTGIVVHRTSTPGDHVCLMPTDTASADGKVPSCIRRYMVERLRPVFSSTDLMRRMRSEASVCILALP